MKSIIFALVQFVRNIHSPRGPRRSKEPSLMELYRLSRGRESISPEIGVILAARLGR